MHISISHGSNTAFSPYEVNSVEDVAKAALKYSVSTGIYKNNKRNIANFKKAEFIGLDVDDGMSIEEAKDKFSKYTHAILPSRNHQAVKNGKKCDRFRVFLQLSEPIFNEKDFYETWHSLQREFNFIDPAAKDPSRQFFACKSIEQVNKSGQVVNVRRWVPKTDSPTPSFGGEKGELGKATLKFLALGAPEGRRNNDLYKALRDLHQNNYSQDEAHKMVFDVCMKSGLSEEEIEQTLDSAYSRDPKHEARVEENDFKVMTVDQLYKSKETKLDWLIKDLLPMGACSIIAGPPKAGKSTLIRQLSAAIAMGQDEFLKRKVKSGGVLYLALEEQVEVLKEKYRKLGIKGSNFHVVIGQISKKTAFDNIKNVVKEKNIKFVVIDTLMVFSEIEDSNNYREAYEAMNAIRDLARETGTHIMCVHHTNKSEYQGTNSIMGSNAFLGGVDCAIIFKAMGERRYIQSTQRSGRPFKGEELYFDKDKETYTIGGVKKETKDGSYRNF